VGGHQPVQDDLFPEVTKFASLPFLPHGIRVLATSLVGGKSVYGMILTELAGNHFFWGIDRRDLLIRVSVASGTITWLVCEALRTARIHT